MKMNIQKKNEPHNNTSINTNTNTNKNEIFSSKSKSPFDNSSHLDDISITNSKNGTKLNPQLGYEIHRHLLKLGIETPYDPVITDCNRENLKKMNGKLNKLHINLLKSCKY